MIFSQHYIIARYHTEEIRTKLRKQRLSQNLIFRNNNFRSICEMKLVPLYRKQITENRQFEPNKSVVSRGQSIVVKEYWTSPGIMMSPNAFRIVGSVFLIFVVLDRWVPSYAEDFNANTFKAVNFMVQKLFVNSFKEATLPPASDAAKGALLYSQRRKSGFTENGKAGMVLQLSIDKLEALITLWRNNDLVSKEAANELRNIISTTGFKKIVDYVNVRANGEMVYAIIGLVQLKKGEKRQGTILYSFRKYKLKKNAAITATVPSASDASCKLWGEFCPTIFKMNGLSNSLFSYLRSDGVKFLVSESGSYVDYLNKEAQRYQRFLPETFKDNLKKLESSPDELPTEIFTADPFTIDQYLR